MENLNIIRKALKTDGIYLFLDLESSSNLEENYCLIGILMY